MIKKNLFILFVFYFFVIQLLFAGLLWDEPNFFWLGLINVVIISLVSACHAFFTREKKQDPDVLLVQEKVTLEHDSGTENKEDENIAISESNIEYIKAKINHSKKASGAGKGLHRLLVFLLALLGLGGILYLFWDILDYFALLIGAIGMLTFVGVIFRAAHLWNKTLFASVYFWFFFLLAGGALAALFYGNNYPVVDTIKHEVSLFFDGLKPENAPQNSKVDLLNQEDEGFLFEETGEVVGITFATGELLSGDQLSGAMNLEHAEEGLQQQSEPANEQDLEQLPAQDLTKKVTMIEAIKHLLDSNQIPLSSAKNTRFTHVATTHPDYPYMKTALEKKMIGSTTNPNTEISCDVYIVMKGLAEGWKVTRTNDIKADYWKLAVAKDVIHGCQKGAKLTVANL